MHKDNNYAHLRDNMCFSKSLQGDLKPCETCRMRHIVMSGMSAYDDYEFRKTIELSCLTGKLYSVYFVEKKCLCTVVFIQHGIEFFTMPSD